MCRMAWEDLDSLSQISWFILYRELAMVAGISDFKYYCRSTTCLRSAIQCSACKIFVNPSVFVLAKYTAWHYTTCRPRRVQNWSVLSKHRYLLSLECIILIFSIEVLVIQVLTIRLMPLASLKNDPLSSPVFNQNIFYIPSWIFDFNHYWLMKFLHNITFLLWAFLYHWILRYLYFINFIKNHSTFRTRFKLQIVSFFGTTRNVPIGRSIMPGPWFKLLLEVGCPFQSFAACLLVTRDILHKAPLSQDGKASSQHLFTALATNLLGKNYTLYQSSLHL